MGSARWWVSFWVKCGVWYGFPADLKAHVFLSSSLSHLTLSILGLNLKRIWSRSWFILFVSDFWQIWKTHLLYVLRRDILGLWNDYLLRVLRRNLLGLWVCERTICCVCWEGIFRVYEREFFGFMNENLLGLWKGDFLDYQLGEKNVQILRLTLPRKCFIKFYFV